MGRWLIWSLLSQKILIIFLLVTAGALYCVKNIKDPAGPVKDYELEDDQRREWNVVKEKWFRNDYQEILKKFNLKIQSFPFPHCRKRTGLPLIMLPVLRSIE